MNRQFDCAEEYHKHPSGTGIITYYRSRIWSDYVGHMVEISGRQGIYTTASAAIAFAETWYNTSR